MALCVITLTSLASIMPMTAMADQYPAVGAWAAFDPSLPEQILESCASYKRDPKRVVGNVIVFDGAKKTEFNGGYLEQEDTTNISVKKIGPNKFRIVDPVEGDEEGGGPRPTTRTYELTLGNGRLLISEGSYPATEYVDCDKGLSKIAAPAERATPPSSLSVKDAPSATSKLSLDQSATAAGLSGEPSSSSTWPLGPLITTTDGDLVRAVQSIQASAGKKDLLGLSPGMTYQDALKVLRPMKDISRSDGHCQVFAYSAAKIDDFASRGADVACTLVDGRLDIKFTTNFSPNRVSSITLDFPSGASKTGMIQNVTDRYGATPTDLSAQINCEAVRPDGLGGVMAAFNRANGEYDRCRRENQARKNGTVRWNLNDGLVVTLERQERHYDNLSNAGFKLILESPQIVRLNREADQSRARNLNARPELTAQKKDIIGIFPGMTQKEIVHVITSHGYYIRPLSQSPIIDSHGRIVPFCSDPEENSNRRGTELKCTQNAEQKFSLQFGFTAAQRPPILSSIQLTFESGLDEMIAYVAEQFDIPPTRVTQMKSGNVAELLPSTNLFMRLEQAPIKKWTLTLSDLAVLNADKKAEEDARRTRNARPKF
jgi:hypothetical protein